jgi:hypothetical protein
VTVVLGCAGTALCLFLALLLSQIGALSSVASRAQLAADAAALAAVAESAPHGGGDMSGAARRYAAANGAQLSECICEAGATFAEVAVEIDGVTATARAVLDVEALAPASIAVDPRGLHPTLAAAVERLLLAAGGAVRVVSAHRTRDDQRALWREALDRYGDPERADDWVARPGTSAHERGLAVDLGGDLELAARLVNRLGLPLHRPLVHEPWHFEVR